MSDSAQLSGFDCGSPPPDDARPDALLLDDASLRDELQKLTLLSDDQHLDSTSRERSFGFGDAGVQPSWTTSRVDGQGVSLALWPVDSAWSPSAPEESADIFSSSFNQMMSWSARAAFGCHAPRLELGARPFAAPTSSSPSASPSPAPSASASAACRPFLPRGTGPTAWRLAPPEEEARAQAKAQAEAGGPRDGEGVPPPAQWPGGVVHLAPGLSGAGAAAECDYAAWGEAHDGMCATLAQPSPPAESADGRHPSLGSAFHGAGDCTPCKFFRGRRGCKDGLSCKFCHHPHGELTYAGIRRKMREKGLQQRRRQQALPSYIPQPMPAMPAGSAMQSMQLGAYLPMSV